MLKETAKLRKEMLTLYKKHLSLLEDFPTEEVAKEKREELDKKYPFEPVDEIINSDDIDIEEEASKVADVAPIVKPNVKPAEQAKPEPKNDKFDQLKFGDNYDVE